MLHLWNSREISCVPPTFTVQCFILSSNWLATFVQGREVDFPSSSRVPLPVCSCKPLHRLAVNLRYRTEINIIGAYRGLYFVDISLWQCRSKGCLVVKEYPWTNWTEIHENTILKRDWCRSEEIDIRVGLHVEHFINGGGSGNMLCRRIHWRSGLSSLALGSLWNEALAIEALSWLPEEANH